MFLKGFSIDQFWVKGGSAAKLLPGDYLGIAPGDFSNESHEAELVVAGLLCANIVLPEEVLPPLLALLPQVPLLQVVNQRYVIML